MPFGKGKIRTANGLHLRTKSVPGEERQLQGKQADIIYAGTRLAVHRLSYSPGAVRMLRADKLSRCPTYSFLVTGIFQYLIHRLFIRLIARINRLSSESEVEPVCSCIRQMRL